MTHQTLVDSLKERLSQSLKKIPTAATLPAEIESGNHEYKYTLADVTEQQLNHRVSQLLWRLKESAVCDTEAMRRYATTDSPTQSERERETAHYHIGVDDDGTPRGLSERDLSLSLHTLDTMAVRTHCEATLRSLRQGTHGLIAEIVFRRKPHNTLTQEHVCVALAGDAHSGKSTLVGVLASQERDNGRGLARLRVLTHNHELASGRTSSIAQVVLPFTAQGELLHNENGMSGGLTTFADHCVSEKTTTREFTNKVSKFVSLIDLAGDKRYLKTTLTGLYGRRPDTVCLTISLTAGVTEMTKEHFAVALALNVPLCVLITKVDYPQRSESEPAVQRILHAVQALLSKRPRSESERERERESLLWPIRDETALEGFLAERETERETVREKVPVLLLSSVTGVGLSLLQRFLFAQRASPTESETAPHGEEDGECIVQILGAIGRGGESWTDDEEERESESDEDTHRVAAKKPRTSLSLSLSSSTAPLSAEREFAEYVAESDADDAKKILLGKVLRGRLSAGDALSLGPSTRGDALRVRVTSVRVHDVPVQFARAGHVVTLCLSRAVAADEERETKRETESQEERETERGAAASSAQMSPASSVRSQSDVSLSPARVPTRRRRAAGLVLRSLSLSAAQWEFTGEVLVMGRALSSWRAKYEPVMHCGAWRQTVRVLSIDRERESDGCGEERALCRFRFAHYPECLSVGDSFVLREGRVQAVGKIVRL